jgi:RNA recognition motif-containing protein
MNNILVGNLSPDASERDIRSLFERHGTVERFRIMTDRVTGQPQGRAFVEMTDDTTALRAIKALNGTEFNGQIIQLNPARPQVHRHSGKGKRLSANQGQ